MRWLVGVVLLLFNLSSAFGDSTQNYESEMQHEINASAFSGSVFSCGLRPKPWVMKVQIMLATGATNVAQNLWPGPNSGLSPYGNAELSKTLAAMSTAFKQGMQAGPAGCEAAADSSDLPRFDRAVGWNQ